MQTMIDTEFSYHGISFDERMAIFSLFHDDEDPKSLVDQGASGLIPEKQMQ